ncbi:MAG: hypothetical protein WCA49_09355 [Candidatus Sulfotelmatobacter sp.]
MKLKLIAGVVGSLAFMFLLAGSAAAQGGQLVAAEYGARDRRVDVTPQVRSYLHDGILRFDVTDQMLGTDPARNHVKELFIRIRHWDGNVEEFRFPEYSHVNLELDPDVGYEGHAIKLSILRAYYGGAGHFLNVTEQLRSYQHQGQLFVVVDDRSMGGDPDPEVHKVLRVLYFAAGERHQIVVPEHAELRLP